MTWIRICRLDRIVPNTGICALVGSAPVAIFRVGTQVFAIDNRDPVTGASVLSRGIVGDAGGVIKVVSPLYKQSYSLETGACLDHAGVGVLVYEARVRAGCVEVFALPRPDATTAVERPASAA